ncbi:MAG TPA: PhaM family polyhydroxyalkanoate granule multifunctional regulatory protein [Burkholderiaceae bacterium]|jgi:hypothetical protein|nr:PhaM family polyhydroxyalkanoate granule multifunctional regulatory protein [Burkholderiaceae bacterium]
MTDPNPLAGMPLAESLANNMNESLQWMSRMWGNPTAAPLGGTQSPLAPGLPSMMMPTLDPNELEKRINDLRTVEHWLDMNRALLHTTIQTLEMQRNGLIALQSMARSAQAGSAAAGFGPAEQAASGAAASSRGEPAAGAQAAAFNPAVWWNALQDQFVRVAQAAAAESERAASASEPQREADVSRPKPPTQPAQSPPESSSGRKAPK